MKYLVIRGNPIGPSHVLLRVQAMTEESMQDLLLELLSEGYACLIQII